ncbi:hypothetical protein [Methylobacterium sp. CM6244]
MNRTNLSVGAAILSLVSISGAEAGGRHIAVDAVYQGPYVQRHGAMLPPQISYRDPRYLPAPRLVRTIYGPPVVLGLVPPHNPNAPVHNEPPPRFSQD